MKKKNSRPIYYLINALRFLIPAWALRISAKKTLAANPSSDNTNRVDYYIKLSKNTEISADAKPIRELRFESPTAFYFDLIYYLRCFPRKLKLDYLFRDITHIPNTPTIVKSRPISDDNQNSVLLKLNKIRHFIFIDDKTPFDSKSPQLVWRGNVLDNQVSRQIFLQNHFNKSKYDIGHVNDYKENTWKVDKLSIEEQLKFKFILSIEGNDVATNLKWIMSSNSLCFMPKPRYETWFMEGLLQPNYHYVLVKDNFSDIEDKVTYYTNNTQEAIDIIENANTYVEQFKNKKQEHLLSLLVLEKYFKLTN